MDEEITEQKRERVHKGRPKVTQISTLQRRCIELLTLGYTKMEVSRQLGINHDTITRWEQQPYYQEARDGLQVHVAESIHNQIISLSGNAIKALEGALTKGKGLTQFQAAKYVIDRIGGDPAVLTRLNQLGGNKEGEEGDFLNLMPYFTEEELTIVEGIMNSARARKAEDVSNKVRPIRGA